MVPAKKENSKPKKDLVVQDQPTDITNPTAVTALATTLAKLIIEKGLFTPIHGKNYVNVEGWQLAGEMTGIFPRMKSVESLGLGNEIKYRAEVELFDIKTGENRGYGVALCSNKEYSKKSFDEYAIMSMAQTRAVGKAYRLTLGWLLKLAGYEATPAEEMAQADTGASAPAEKVEDAPATETQRIILQSHLRSLGKSDEEIAETLAQLSTASQANAWIAEAKRRIAERNAAQPKPEPTTEELDAEEARRVLDAEFDAQMRAEQIIKMGQFTQEATAGY